jgi:hypothetical protein
MDYEIQQGAQLNARRNRGAASKDLAFIAALAVVSSLSTKMKRPRIGPVML